MERKEKEQSKGGGGGGERSGSEDVQNVCHKEQPARAHTHAPHAHTRIWRWSSGTRTARPCVGGAHQPKPKLWMKICYAVLQCIIDAHPSKVGLDLSYGHIVKEKKTSLRTFTCRFTFSCCLPILPPPLQALARGVFFINQD